MRDTRWWSEYGKFLKSEQWKTTRIRILNAYGHKCFCCKTRRGHIQVHHLTYDKYRNPPLKDVRPLCVDCHKEVTAITRRGKLKSEYALAHHIKTCKKRKGKS